MRKRPRRSARAVLLLVGVVAVVAVLAWGGWLLLRPKGPTPVLASPPAAGHANATLNTSLINGVNEFGFDLLRRESTFNPSSPSVVLSPISVHSALAMAESGAAGDTSLHIRRVLRIDALKPAVARQAYANLLVNLADAEKGQLAIANSLWTDKDHTFKKTFVDADTQFFGAEAQSVDLHSASGVDSINSWVSKSTGNRIASVIGAPLPKNAPMELVNAAYFLGTWQHQFDPRETKAADFHPSSGPTVKAQMMSLNSSFGHIKTTTYEAVRLPYKGSNAAMIVILPSSKSSLSKVLKSFDAARFAKMRSGLSESDGTLKLPRLEARGTLKLNGALETMGMSDAFSSSRADFSAMTELTPLWLDRVQHSTYLHVDEQGTEAAAATEIESQTKTAPNHPFKMTVDRPYIMAIVDERSGVILFLAAVQDPRG
jgi:serine protease inhibitor